MFKSGFITIVGRPNVGKSTILNLLMEEKLSIVTSKPQTTRKKMNAIYTDDEAQLIFVDTPGIHKAQSKLGEYMVTSAKESFSDVDVILFVTTPVRNGEIHTSDQVILKDLKNIDKPVFLLINKIDEFTPAEIAKTLEVFAAEMDFVEFIPMSARKKRNTDILMDLIKDNLEEGPMYYPEDIVADVEVRFLMAEIIREKMLKLLRDEIPHGVAVEIISMKEKKNGNYDILADILCEKDSHKGIIIGKNGKTLKKIGKWSRSDMEDYLGVEVNLKTFVKVKKDWRDNPNILKELGYDK